MTPPLRRAETFTASATTAAAVAGAVVGVPPVTGQIELAWRQVLLNHFHDTAAGTALPSAYDDARDQLGEPAWPRREGFGNVPQRPTGFATHCAVIP